MRWLILILFVLTYIGISARRLRVLPVGRPAMALIGASAVIAVGAIFATDPHALEIDDALRAVEPHTIGLLFGMMLIAAGLAEAGFFAWATAALSRRVRTGPALLWAVTIGSGLLSAVLVNDAVCLLATPLIIGVVALRGFAVRPFVFALAMGSNAGSALTLSGNPQNMLVAKLSGLGYRAYLLDAAIPAIGALLLTAATLHWMFRRELSAAPTPVVAPAADPVIVDRGLYVLGVAALLGVVVANVGGASLSLTALVGGSVVLLAARMRAERVIAQVDWSVLLFFAGLFVLVAGLQKTALPAEALTAIGADGHAAGVLELTAVLAIGSQIVSNVPLILLLQPWIAGQPDPDSAWRLTALITTLAGNLTLLGSVANIIVIERARAQVGFIDYLKIGLPVTAISIAWVLLVHALVG